MNVILTQKGKIEIRELHDIAEMRAAEIIQTKVWGAEIIPHPKELLIPVQHEGGLLAGAFSAENEMVGIIFGFPTQESGVMHSQMLATLESWRGLGIGANLKWYQRRWCLEHGYQYVRWTVDPLRTANAELNIRHLGGTSRTYLSDYYGPMLGIDSGSPTDRLVIDWDLTSERVRLRESHTPDDFGFVKACMVNQIEQGAPLRLDIEPDPAAILVRLPPDYVKMSKTDSKLALDWRLHSRDLLLQYFSQGYIITEFTRVGGPAYLLEGSALNNEA